MLSKTYEVQVACAGAAKGTGHAGSRHGDRGMVWDDTMATLHHGH